MSEGQMGMLPGTLDGQMEMPPGTSDEQMKMPQDWQSGMIQRGQRPQGGGGMGGFRVTEGALIRISGGTIDIYAAKDGLDSNNNIFLEGGTVNVNGASMGMDGAVDMDGNFIVSGGKFVAAGSVSNYLKQRYHQYRRRRRHICCERQRRRYEISGQQNGRAAAGW